MVTILFDHDVVNIPKGISSLASFRRWLHSDKFPEHARIDYIDGNLWVEPSGETILHNQIKVHILTALYNWSDKLHIPTICLTGMRITCQQASLSMEPDVIYSIKEASSKRNMRLPYGNDSRDLLGAPDIVVEITNNRNVTRNEQALRTKYWQAGVKEYWIADSRKTPTLSILRRNGKKFVAVTADMQGWLRSSVLKAQCRLVTKPGPAATTRVTLEMKPLK